MRKFLTLVILVTLLAPQALARNKCDDVTKLLDLVSEPKKFLGKKISVKGDFYSFSTLPLDYKPAMRSSKDFIGIVLARPDQKEIPLVELKLAVPLKKFKDTSVSIEHGDEMVLRGKVYAVALGEPWLDVDSFEVEEKEEE